MLRFLLFGDGDAAHQPLIMVDGWNLSDVNSEKVVIKLTDDSTMVDYEVALLKNKDDLPVAYTSYITTPVCDDTLCALMHIQMYWNLLGNYIGFDTIGGMPLTKNDHLEFRDEDYSKLHRLLMDDHSIIKRKDKKELFDNEAMRVSEVVDAVTGATAKEVKEAVVDGALYSSYTIYHIVYGSLSDSIYRDFERKYNPLLQHKLLSSDHPDYQLYALKRLDKESFIHHKDRLLELIHLAIPLNRLYIMKKMPDHMWHNQKVQEEIAEFYTDLDVNSMSYFLRKLVSIDHISSTTILRLVNSIEHMSQNQMKALIRILSKKETELTEVILDRIKANLQNKNITYAYLMEAFLKEVAKEVGIEN